MLRETARADSKMAALIHAASEDVAEHGLGHVVKTLGVGRGQEREGQR